MYIYGRYIYTRTRVGLLYSYTCTSRSLILGPHAQSQHTRPSAARAKFTLIINGPLMVH